MNADPILEAVKQHLYIETVLIPLANEKARIHHHPIYIYQTASGAFLVRLDEKPLTKLIDGQKLTVIYTAYPKTLF